ncbi:MAG: DUF1549 domain-containing protein [Mongoliibacter sp.]|uniref:DUF1549 domain-containing protein n=1 Tax=Mongoliibacter sp. TaxID=2022438 RepID=UPI0012F0F577|nr:DUF1549 domain-containing protein [Mongoliibacter sp.]TVP47674.1 MAG: DUF1549 domain-containing protein [Mongoliibacter sp.]
MIVENFWLWQFLGRLHPLVVHFPIALLVFAAILELFTIGKYQSKLRPGINAILLGGIFSAIIAAFFGWQLAENENITGDLLDQHQRSGFVTATIGLVLLWFLTQIEIKKRTKNIKFFRATLFVTTLGIILTGHFGASLTHGEDFLSSTLPWGKGNAPYQPNQFDLAHYQSEGATLSTDAELKLIGEVRTILAHNCYKCHSGAKIEGDLRLDTKEHVFKGGESGAVVVAGVPQQSELIRRIKLPKNHKDVMPAKGSILSKEEIALLTLWVEKGAPWPDNATQPSIYRVADLAPRRPPLPKSVSGLINPVDLFVNDYFQEKNIQWPQGIDDKTFLRRVYLDLIGLLPSPEDLEAFSKDPRTDKRSILVEELLNRNDDFAMHWLTFWNDHLRNDYTGTGYITNGRYNITDWLYQSLLNNKPYDVFIKELLNPDEKSKGFIEGIRWRGTVNASQRTEMQAAQNVGQVILGLNLKCASCHDSFISDWKLDQAYAFANIFADTTLEVSRCEQPTGKMASTKILWEELGEIDSLATKAEKLRQLSEHLVQPANGRMYRTIVNRIWKQLMGRGLVEPVDEMDNMPWSQDLLDWLATEFVDTGYDLKELIYRVATSKIYQSASSGIESAGLLQDEDYVFTGMARRRMTAEQFSDAVSQIIHPLFDEQEIKYNPFQLAKNEASVPAFVRASLVANNSFLTALGRPNREIVTTSRDSQASLLQALELTNGERLYEVLEKGAVSWREQFHTAELISEQFYQKVLLRKPSQKELKIAKDALGDQPKAEQIQDFFWAVMLLPEFQIIY